MILLDLKYQQFTEKEGLVIIENQIQQSYSPTRTH